MPTRAQIEDVYEGFSDFWSILDFIAADVRTKLYRKYMRLTSLTSLMSLMSQKEEFFLLGIPKRKNSSFWLMRLMRLVRLVSLIYFLYSLVRTSAAIKSKIDQKSLNPSYTSSI